METKLRKDLAWFTPLRLATFVVLFAIVAFWMHYPGFLRAQFITYSIFTLGLALLLAWNRKRELERICQIVIAIQFLLEISIESGVIYATGNINSTYSALFILTIVSAALYYRLVGTLIMASLVSLAYAFIIWLGLADPANPDLSVDALKTIFEGSDSAFYAIFLHILIFYLVAFISGYLAERFKIQGAQLADTSRALKIARLETDDILKHLNSGLLTIDPEGYIIYFNRAAERILGYEEEEVRGLHCAEAFAERMPEFADRLMEGLEINVEHPRREIEITNLNGFTVPLGLSTSVLRDDDGNPRGVISIFSELTETKLMEAKMRTADRLAAIGELSASIAHEIRNPLASISGSVEVLSNELKLDGENERLMSLIVKESHRLSKILTDFLTYARISSPNYSKIELCHLVGDVIEMLFHHHSFKKNVEISFDSDESIVYIIGDEDLIKQLLINLAVNACEAIGDAEGKIIIKLTTDPVENQVILSLSDNGPGISEENIKNIYKPFFSTKQQGTGLGLSIVHRVAAALKLQLTVDSGPGEGTNFEVRFPRFSESRAHSTRPDAILSK